MRSTRSPHSKRGSHLALTLERLEAHVRARGDGSRRRRRSSGSA